MKENFFKRFFKSIKNIFKKDTPKLLNAPDEIISSPESKIVIPEKIVINSSHTQVPSENNISNFKSDSELVELATEFKKKSARVEVKRARLAELDEKLQELTMEYEKLLMN